MRNICIEVARRSAPKHQRPSFIEIEIKTPEANLLREATLILDRHAPEAISTTTGLKSTKVCDTASLIWAIRGAVKVLPL